ncbi:hypothetical protein JX265_006847 [Neoarthrinium moseri]|uniref:Uncharacterized protein n=1 Tax=Neoarthrinium moseri TaxID=1658444 RepID=A0A9Q0AP49_9PEZI|nr:hypothetical protein JX265_006847 [Neoarthrinium moseri]
MQVFKNLLFTGLMTLPVYAEPNDARNYPALLKIQKPGHNYIADCSLFLKKTVSPCPVTITVTGNVRAGSVIVRSHEASGPVDRGLENRGLKGRDLDNGGLEDRDLEDRAAYPISSRCPITSSARSLPSYAKARCHDAAHYSSACGCLGVAGKTTTLPAQTVTTITSPTQTSPTQPPPSQSSSTTFTCSTSSGLLVYFSQLLNPFRYILVETDYSFPFLSLDTQGYLTSNNQYLNVPTQDNNADLIYIGGTDNLNVPVSNRLACTLLPTGPFSLLNLSCRTHNVTQATFTRCERPGNNTYIGLSSSVPSGCQATNLTCSYS